MTVTVADVIRTLERWYPPELAESWDHPGLAVGRPEATAGRILFALEITAQVVDEAVAVDASLIVTHHPLLFRPIGSLVSAPGPAGLALRLAEHRIAAFSAHTNADAARPGVSDALADRLGLTGVEVLVPVPQQQVKIVVTVPPEQTEAVIDAAATAGAGRLGNYSHAAFVSAGTGRFTPGPGAKPAIGRIGIPELVAEERIELIAPAGAAHEVVLAVRAAHPYEEPAIDVYPLAAGVGGSQGAASTQGSGRIGRLPAPARLADFVAMVSAQLPCGPAGVRASGDPDSRVHTVAVCGGAGLNYLAAARAAGADVFVTGDAGHHPALDATAAGAPALVDAGHYGTERPFIDALASRMATQLEDSGAGPQIVVSTVRTDPWTMWEGSNT